ncbi:MAG: hypothetical protein ACTMUB_05795 [cyanobacterium endosymbiont of Rhopalodia musculus]|uniref:hypothetical protein n=1 Tax=cyanobacterium endosymbiont of Epithemia clementina EcSB TaxID=3034674 RepID=UPI00247FD437|nr:hypothetical protein [cyanobacterium endosymbiont of Epithemia clementina EcSB]WGT67652.1 hypothetical protein P3F56_00655 [cyanobacterium endosymbiont of Epithemia clementina EcSB]
MIWKTIRPRNYRLYLQWNMRLLVIFLLSASLVIGGGRFRFSRDGNFKVQSVSAQTLRPEEAAAIVYEQLPYLSREAQYTRNDTKNINTVQTLISRFIRYHRDLKRRAPSIPLDWKITLADYLGVNESIQKDSYPGSSTLPSSPMETDVEAIQELNRHQRQELVDVLVSIYAPKQKKLKVPTIQIEPIPELSQPTPTISPGLSKPGDADLLK